MVWEGVEKAFGWGGTVSTIESMEESIEWPLEDMSRFTHSSQRHSWVTHDDNEESVMSS